MYIMGFRLLIARWSPGPLVPSGSVVPSQTEPNLRSSKNMLKVPRIRVFSWRWMHKARTSDGGCTWRQRPNVDNAVCTVTSLTRHTYACCTSRSSPHNTTTRHARVGMLQSPCVMCSVCHLQELLELRWAEHCRGSVVVHKGVHRLHHGSCDILWPGAA